MRYFLDTEFMEDGMTIELLSIGIVCADGREYYAENLNADWSKANDWVRENVLPHLSQDRRPSYGPSRATGVIAAEVCAFIDEEEPEFWGYYCDYDWVALCQLFGTMTDLPAGWPMLAYDLRQWAVQLGNPTLPEQTSTEHHALSDAIWVRDAWQFLKEYPWWKWPV